MKQILFTLATSVALLAAPSDAHAVFTKFLIDGFDDPGIPVHASMPGMSRALGGTGGAVVPITGTDIAVDRGLAGRPPMGAGPFDPGALVVDPSDLEIRLGPNEMAWVGWDVGGFDFALADAPFIVLAGLTNFGPAPASLLIFLEQTFALPADFAIVTLAPGQTADVALTASPGATTFLALNIVNIGDDPFQGTAESVVANPEPATMALMGIGILGGAVGYRRRRKRIVDVPNTAA